MVVSFRSMGPRCTFIILWRVARRHGQGETLQSKLSDTAVFIRIPLQVLFFNVDRRLPKRPENVHPRFITETIVADDANFEAGP